MINFQIKNKEGLFSNGKTFTKHGKVFTTEGALTNSVIQSSDQFQYMGKDIMLVITEDMITKEIPIEPWLYEKLTSYYSKRDYSTEIGDNLRLLGELSRAITKNGYDISDEWE
jgi:hypothetical protein